MSAITGHDWLGPLADHLVPHFSVTGFDIGSKRIAELCVDDDRTCYVKQERLATTTVSFTDDCEKVGGLDVYIVTGLTPVNTNKELLLGAVTP